MAQVFSPLTILWKQFCQNYEFHAIKKKKTLWGRKIPSKLQESPSFFQHIKIPRQSSPSYASDNAGSHPQYRTSGRSLETPGKRNVRANSEIAGFCTAGRAGNGCANFIGNEKTNKHKAFWRHTPWCASRLSRGHVPSVPWYVPPVPGTFCPFSIDLHIDQAQMSQVSLGRPEFVPGTPPGHPDRQIPLCDFSLSVFFSPYCMGAWHFWALSAGKPPCPKNSLF